MTEAFPLQWPSGWPRTPSHARERGYEFRQHRKDGGYGTTLVTFAVARDKLYDEIKRLGGTSPIVSTNHPKDRYGIPTESKRSEPDEGVAVYFAFNGKPMVMACDRFDNAAANMRSLGLAIEAMRQLERHGGGTMIDRAFTGFVALPAPKSLWEVLGLTPGASEEQIEAAYRRRARHCHPDVPGGSAAAMAELTDARQKLKEKTA